MDHSYFQRQPRSPQPSSTASCRSDSGRGGANQGQGGPNGSSGRRPADFLRRPAPERVPDVQQPAPSWETSCLLIFLKVSHEHHPASCFIRVSEKPLLDPLPERLRRSDSHRVRGWGNTVSADVVPIKGTCWRVRLPEFQLSRRLRECSGSSFVTRLRARPDQATQPANQSIWGVSAGTSAVGLGLERQP
jgi:hypothetical protein